MKGKLFLGLSLSAMLMITGCGKAESKLLTTAPDVMTQMEKAVTSAGSAKVGIDMDLGVTLSAEGEEPATMGLDGTVDCSYIKDGKQFELDMSLVMDVNGDTENMDGTIKMRDEDGVFTTYSKEDGDAAWIRRQPDMSGFDLDALLNPPVSDSTSDTSSSESATGTDYSGYVLTEGLVELDGKQCYEVKATVDSDTMLDTLKKDETMAQYLEELDLDALAQLGDSFLVETVTYVDSKTLYPVQTVVDLSGFDIDALFDIVPMLSFLNDAGVSIDLDPAIITVTYSDVNSVGEIVFPDESEVESVDY